MLAALIRFALRFPLAIVTAALVLLGYGSFKVVNGKYDVFPEFVPAQASIQTEAPGLLAEDVERLVTQPLENAINGGANIATVRSKSSQGLSLIDITFNDGTDIFRDRQLLSERLVEVSGSLPTGVGTPVLGAMTSSTMDLLKVGFTSDKLTPLALRDLVEWTIKPRLLSVPGVARAIVYGGERREIQVAIDPAKLTRYRLGANDVINAVNAAIGIRATGFVDTPTQRVLMRATVNNQRPQDIAAMTVTQREGANVTVGDVASVSYAPEPQFGDARVQGGPDVLLSMGSQYQSNTLDVTYRVEAALNELRPMLNARGVTMYPALHRPATFIEVALKSMRNALLYGALLVALVLIAFLRSWRTALISFVAIPLSLLFAILVMDAMGWTINVMTLSGLAVAVGVVVDDAIIDVENIVRRLRHAKRLRSLSPVEAIILNASVEVRRPIVLATLVVAMVFVPMLLLPGLQGSFFAPMAAAFLLATLGSLLVALTVTPALCLLMLHKRLAEHEPRWLRRLKLLQHRVLEGCRKLGTPILLVSLLMGAIAVSYATTFGRELMPMFREGHLVVQLFGPTGTSLSEMARVGDRIAAQALKIPGIATVSQQIGRAEASEDPWEPSRSEFHIELKPNLSARDEDRIQNAMHQLLDGFPGFESEVVTFLGDRISESISGETAMVSVNVIGPDLQQLDAVAQQVATLLKTLPESGEVVLDTSSALPTMQVRLKPDKLAEFGLRTTDVLDVLRMAYAGNEVGQVFAGNQSLKVRVTLKTDQRRDPESVSQLRVHTPAGRDVPLSMLADVDLVDSRGVISHDGGLRRQVININPDTRDVVGFVDQARTAVNKQIKLPQGVYLEWGGAAAETSAATRQLLLNSLLAVVAVVGLLWATFRRWRVVALVLVNVPFALLGGVLAVALTGASLSIGSLVGFVTLFGISARNAIMLMAHYDQLQFEERYRWSVALALRGARERLTPILMTALVTALGLLPLALGSGEAGREIEGPMAIVILGGLLSSTLLNLWLMPVIAARFWPESAMIPRADPTN
jgi:CzcA family heavy metal efflux pump